MKKLLALLLALAVSFSLAIPAFAANTALDGIEYDGYTVLSNCSDDELWKCQEMCSREIPKI